MDYMIEIIYYKIIYLREDILRFLNNERVIIKEFNFNSLTFYINDHEQSYKVLRYKLDIKNIF